ncbi:hydroxyacylglutathione hydrolase [Aliidiomarina minuta]|nr:hydroxyacylglutathione hydrolase [Aliidiomarina minuta]
MHIHAIPAFNDNYIWILQPKDSTQCVIVDPGDAQPVMKFLAEHQLTPAALLITHHHHDHTGGIQALTDRYAMPVYGPAEEDISGVTDKLRGGDSLPLTVLNLTFNIIDCPGHTNGHIAFYSAPLLFCGDTLFSAGCGRMFEGTPEQFIKSLRRFKALPDETLVYCAHEYTAANLEFAKAVEPDNQAISSHQQWVAERRQANEITVPSTLRLERKINPFLRCHLFSVQQSAQRYAQTSLADEVEVFACIREWKDNF